MKDYHKVDHWEGFKVFMEELEGLSKGGSESEPGLNCDICEWRRMPQCVPRLHRLVMVISIIIRM